MQKNVIIIGTLLPATGYGEQEIGYPNFREILKEFIEKHKLLKK